MAQAEIQSSSVGLAGILGIVFVAMKLGQVGEVASWSWLWVLSPFWIPLALTVAVLLVIAVFALVATLFKGVGDYFTRRRRMRDLLRQ